MRRQFSPSGYLFQQEYIAAIADAYSTDTDQNGSIEESERFMGDLAYLKCICGNEAVHSQMTGECINAPQIPPVLSPGNLYSRPDFPEYQKEQLKKGTFMTASLVMKVSFFILSFYPIALFFHFPLA